MHHHTRVRGLHAHASLHFKCFTIISFSPRCFHEVWQCRNQRSIYQRNGLFDIGKALVLGEWFESFASFANDCFEPF